MLNYTIVKSLISIIKLTGEQTHVNQNYFYEVLVLLCLNKRINSVTGKSQKKEKFTDDGKKLIFLHMDVHKIRKILPL